MMPYAGSSKKLALLTSLAMLVAGAEISSAATLTEPFQVTNANHPLTIAFDFPNLSQGPLVSVGFNLISAVDDNAPWDLLLSINSGAFLVPASGGISQGVNVQQSSSDPNILAAFTAVGVYPVIFGYHADCNTDPPCSLNGWHGTLSIIYTTAPPSVVPLPAALPLFATGLGALGLLGWRRKKRAAALAA